MAGRERTVHPARGSRGGRHLGGGGGGGARRGRIPTNKQQELRVGSDVKRCPAEPGPPSRPRPPSPPPHQEQNPPSNYEKVNRASGFPGRLLFIEWINI